jgi:hypothetical protein
MSSSRSQPLGSFLTGGSKKKIEAFVQKYTKPLFDTFFFTPFANLVLHFALLLGLFAETCLRDARYAVCCV